MPTCVAVIVHTPALARVTKFPETVQTLCEVDVNVTGRPDVADAAIATGFPPSIWVETVFILMVCGASTENVWVTGTAAV